MSLFLMSLSENIEGAFKSLMQSGRPDVIDEKRNNITPDIYVDLFKNNYVLRQVLDDNHTLLKGRRGTGKSTIFVKAEDHIKNNIHDALPIYINLQTCYEEIRTSNSDIKNSDLTNLTTYKNFLTEILESIKNKLPIHISNEEEVEVLFRSIRNGDYIDADFQRMAEQSKNALNENTYGDNKNFILRELNEIRIFSIHTILKRIQKILKRNNIYKVYLFLDDFSELNEESQRAVIDSLIAPIISSYNETFKVKIAAYPGRVSLGNADATKIVPVPLDFYDAYESSTANYPGVEKAAINYIRRTLEKRLEIFTQNQIFISDIFEITDHLSLDDYLKKLFDCTSAIPRSLGYILNYCYLASINNGMPINMLHIDNAAIKYYEENIHADFINDARFKQSFYDDKTLLDQVAQKNLMDEIVKYLYNLKRDTVESFTKGTLSTKLFQKTLQKKGSNYWLPTSYFYINKKSENLLKTLELYYIVSKHNEGSVRGAMEGKVSYYCLNYGLCLAHKIDFGRPAGRRKYDYWRHSDFNLTDYIPKVLSNIEIIICKNCGKEYNEVEYDIYQTSKNCFQCTKNNTVKKRNKFEDKLETKIAEWKQKSLPNAHVSVLRLLYNNRESELSAYQIGELVDKHHLTITNTMKTLSNKGYAKFRIKNKRYYSITSASISEFFSDSIDHYYE
ncbi:hypothetical protein CN383_11155 [Priestia megaterium]|uniref:hypothetical protein n=1 Tax=Priestia megaterium TaxID=1404 RepID=UPI000BF556B2|nr:hypothetical protein [Priestia megaterium]PFB01856.1 hypothetical protein CN383_11155 [Priestia megaterium]